MRLLSALVVSVFVSMLAVVGPAQSGIVTVEITGNGTGSLNGIAFGSPFDFHLVGPDSNSNVVNLTLATVSIGLGPANAFTDPMHIGLNTVSEYAFFGYQAGGPDLMQLIFSSFDFALLSNSNSFTGTPTGFNLAFLDVPTLGGPLSFTDFSDLSLSAASTGSGSQTPLPAALPLFAGGLGVIGLLARRRKRKAAAIAAA